jgi:hypothetical protein
MGKMVIHIYVCGQGHTQFMWRMLAVLFQPAKFEQTIIQQHVLLQRESLINGTAVTIILCWHVLIADHIFINFWIC